MLKQDVNIDEVRNFWEKNPLFSDESQYEVGTKKFFDEHDRVVIEDCYAGKIDGRIFPEPSSRNRVLDVGCGIGFCIVQLAKVGWTEIFGVDITQTALELTQQRCLLNYIQAKLLRQNAEKLEFPDGFFDHVNCLGVIHHTPHPEVAIREISRVLKPGGTATISVYYKNLFIKHWNLLWPLGRLFHLAGARLKGRHREDIFAVKDASEIVRMYDGIDNPLGICYSKKEFYELVSPDFKVCDSFCHFFPRRALPFRIPHFVHKLMQKYFGFAIVATLIKK